VIKNALEIILKKKTGGEKKTSSLEMNNHQVGNPEVK
jgi:hypothetical protein